MSHREILASTGDYTTVNWTAVNIADIDLLTPNGLRVDSVPEVSFLKLVRLQQWQFEGKKFMISINQMNFIYFTINYILMHQTVGTWLVCVRKIGNCQAGVRTKKYMLEKKGSAIKIRTKILDESLFYSQVPRLVDLKWQDEGSSCIGRCNFPVFWCVGHVTWNWKKLMELEKSPLIIGNR